jgi:PAS domain S-box-containing protein
MDAANGTFPPTDAPQDAYEHARAQRLLNTMTVEETGRRNKGPLTELVLIGVLTVFVYVIGDWTDCFLPFFKYVAENDSGAVDVHADETSGALVFLLIAMGFFAYRRWMECRAEVIVQTRDLWTLHSLNDEMEARVWKRTAQLDGANRALRTEVTERQRAEVEVKQFAEIIESTGDAILSQTSEGIITSWNPAAEKMLGYSAEEIVGNSAQVLIPPERQEENADLLGRISRGEQVGHQETVLTRKDGSPVDVAVTISPLRDANGNTAGVSLIVRDITEYKKAKESLTLFRALLDRSSDGIEVIDPESGRFLDVNETTCERLNYSREELLTMRIVDTSTTMTDMSAWKKAADYLQKSGSTIVESNLRRKDGSTFPVEIHARYIELNRKYLVAVVRDITERKRAEAALEKANRDLVDASHHAGMAEIATGVLHNVGNVLNSLNVSTNVLADHVRTTPVADLGRVAALLQAQGPNLGEFFTHDERAPKVVEFLSSLAEMFNTMQATKLGEVASIKKNIDHIKDIVMTQQNYAGASGLTESLRIEDLVEDTLHINASKILRHKVEVVCEFAPELPAISTEKHKVLQVLINLVDNAKSACSSSPRKDKRIKIQVTHGAGRMRVAVVDNGVGISPETLSHIFQYGFTTKKDGHGFGLHNSANAAREMGGSLTVQSDGEGSGATFTLEIPLECRK